MNSYQERVQIEKEELDAKIAKLMEYIKNRTNTGFSNLDYGEQSRMRIQLVAMQTYSVCLGERIVNFPGTLKQE
jgi:hypothetical protein